MYAIRENGSRIYGYFNTENGPQVLSFSTKVKDPKYHIHYELNSIHVKQIINQQNKIIILDYDGIIYDEQYSRYGKYGTFKISNLLQSTNRYKLISASDHGPSIIGVTFDNILCINFNGFTKQVEIDFEIVQAYVFRFFMIVIIDSNGNVHKTTGQTLSYNDNKIYTKFITDQIDNSIIKCVYADYMTIGLSQNGNLYHITNHPSNNTDVIYKQFNIDNIKDIFMSKYTHQLPVEYRLYYIRNEKLYSIDNIDENFNNSVDGDYLLDGFTTNDIKSIVTNTIDTYIDSYYLLNYQYFFCVGWLPHEWLHTRYPLVSPNSYLLVKNARNIM